ncbi:MAG TPA: hypothetical protein VFS21_35565 [Roseiflexaceae bacterium]|nr:hypothetical protein [Roseiflexaceae bacterium]
MEVIPDELKQFIFASFETIDQLRVLLLLHSGPERDWLPLAVSTRLYLRPTMARHCLDALAQRGFLQAEGAPDPRYRYRPARAELAALVDAVVDLDRTRPVTLINLVHARPKDPPQSFADTAKLRKDG